VLSTLPVAGQGLFDGLIYSLILSASYTAKLAARFFGHDRHMTTAPPAMID
jgi:hypothetical protein